MTKLEQIAICSRMNFMGLCMYEAHYEKGPLSITVPSWLNSVRTKHTAIVLLLLIESSSI